MQNHIPEFSASVIIVIPPVKGLVEGTDFIRLKNKTDIRLIFSLEFLDLIFCDTTC